jgi:hypothetical protein
MIMLYEQLHVVLQLSFEPDASNLKVSHARLRYNPRVMLLTTVSR